MARYKIRKNFLGEYEVRDTKQEAAGLAFLIVLVIAIIYYIAVGLFHLLKYFLSLPKDKQIITLKIAGIIISIVTSVILIRHTSSTIDRKHYISEIYQKTRVGQEHLISSDKNLIMTMDKDAHILIYNVSGNNLELEYNQDNINISNRSTNQTWKLISKTSDLEIPYKQTLTYTGKAFDTYKVKDGWFRSHTTTVDIPHQNTIEIPPIEYSLSTHKDKILKTKKIIFNMTKAEVDKWIDKNWIEEYENNNDK